MSSLPTNDGKKDKKQEKLRTTQQAKLDDEPDECIATAVFGPDCNFGPELKQVLERLSLQCDGLKVELCKFSPLRKDFDNDEAIVAAAGIIRELSMTAYGALSFGVSSSKITGQLLGIDFSDLHLDVQVWRDLDRALSAPCKHLPQHPLVQQCDYFYRRLLASPSYLLMSDPPYAETAESSFYSTEYIADEHYLLAETIRSWEKIIAESGATQWHARCLSIIQSSGMGKSRLLRELNNVPGFSVFVLCLRPGQPLPMPASLRDPYAFSVADDCAFMPCDTPRHRLPGQ